MRSQVGGINVAVGVAEGTEVDGIRVLWIVGGASAVEVKEAGWCVAIAETPVAVAAGEAGSQAAIIRAADRIIKRGRRGIRCWSIVPRWSSIGFAV
jgi:hypothetical protein